MTSYKNPATQKQGVPIQRGTCLANHWADCGHYVSKGAPVVWWEDRTGCYQCYPLPEDDPDRLRALSTALCPAPLEVADLFGGTDGED